MGHGRSLALGQGDRPFNLVSCRRWSIAELAAIATKKAGLIQPCFCIVLSTRQFGKSFLLSWPHIIRQIV